MQGFEIVKDIPAPPEAVWNVLIDSRALDRWSGLREVVLRQEGYPPPDGLGAIRMIRHGGLAIEEEITGFDPPKRLTYRITRGAPVRDHRGEVRVEPAEGGSRVAWSVEFKARIPGTGPLLRRGFQRALEGLLTRLAAYPFSASGS